MKIRKEKITKDDGRYLIFYEFETKDRDTDDQKEKRTKNSKPKSQERTTKHV